MLGVGIKSSVVSTLSPRHPLNIQAEMSNWRLELIEVKKRVIHQHIDGI